MLTYLTPLETSSTTLLILLILVCSSKAAIYLFRFLIYFPIESTLDVQYIMGIAPGVPTSFFVVDGYFFDLIYVYFFQHY